MKLNCGMSQEEKRKQRWEAYRAYQDEYDAGGGWYDWFAWYPVRVGEGDCRWLETVEVRSGRPWVSEITNNYGVLPSLYFDARAKVNS